MGKIGLPNISKLVGSKNFILDVGIIFAGFLIMGFATAAGNFTFEYLYNNYWRKPTDKEIPYV